MHVRLPLVLAVFLGLAACSGDDDEADASSEGIEGVVIERIGPYDHIDADLDYDRPAPSGGDHPHLPWWLQCGVYEGVVPDELAVHSLEHGAAWIALGPESTTEDRRLAGELANGEKVIVSDVPDLPNPVELVAWGVRLPLDGLDDPRAEPFLDEFVDAAGAPETGSACDSEFGSPPTPPPLPEFP